MKARNHTINCSDLAQFKKLQEEYLWLGENIETDQTQLTITILALPKDSKRIRERQARIDARHQDDDYDYGDKYN